MTTPNHDGRSIARPMGLHRHIFRWGTLLALLVAVLALTAEDHGINGRGVTYVRTHPEIDVLGHGQLTAIDVRIGWSAGLLGAGICRAEDVLGNQRIVLARRALPASGEELRLVVRGNWALTTPWGRFGRYLDQIEPQPVNGGG